MNKKRSSLVGVSNNLPENLDIIEAYLKDSLELKVNKIKEGIYNIQWEGKEFEVFIYYLNDINGCLHNFIGRNQYLNEKDLNILKEIEEGIEIEIEYNEDLLSSFHLHLKLIDLIIPDLNAVLDMSSFSILNKEWVKIASRSIITPSPDYLVNIHGVAMEDETGWYHTHGLERFGFNEVEIKGFPCEDGQLYYPLLDTFIKNIINGNLGEKLKEKEVFWGIQNYPLTLIKDENSIEKEEHHENNLEIKVYASEEDYSNGIISDITLLKNDLENNPIFYISDEETNRMSILAKEREYILFPFLENKNGKILIKFGLDTDNPEKDGEKEHLWFDIIEENNKIYKGILTNAPYFIKNIKEGDILEISREKMTDWIIYYNEEKITPDTIFLLKEMEKNTIN